MSPALDLTPAPHRPRNKLRKPSKLRPGSSVSNSASPRHSSDSPRNSNSSTGQGGTRTPQSPRTTLPLPPDLSDSKWLEYIRQSGYLVPMEKSPRLESAKSPLLECAKSPRLETTRLQLSSNNSSGSSNSGGSSTSNSGGSSISNNTVPELAHLALDVPAKSPRKLPESQTPPSDPPKPTSLSLLRRHPKPPVIRIAQLGGNDEAARTDKAPGVEQIPDQYRAVPGPRADASSKGREDGRRHDAETRQASVDAIRGAILRRRSPVRPSSPLPSPSTAPPVPAALATRLTSEWEQPEGSPTSDGTLVAFEEDAIYFKPVSYSPEALSPILEDDVDDPTSPNYHPSYSSFYNPAGYGPLPPLSSPSSSSYAPPSSPQRPAPPPAATPRPDVLSLQIAMDLLTRELSSAVSNESPKAPADVRSLQIWVMIEAYERLRDQVMEMNVGMPVEEVRALMGMFNMWIRALQGVQQRFRDRGRPGLVGGVEGLQTEDLD
ncbi:hypothetical protein VSDG_09799 [Cytospora chrysosperma]|uniref:Mating-type switching protein swi10 n=1 Tax=Cytospora chrysosperma TaxID=252740 RepID=A0A423V9G6_CYTCH|nr:hypothetical protein VSDG_09799 [Valsa sordida]